MRRLISYLLLGSAAATPACARILGDDFCRADDPACEGPTTTMGSGGTSAGGSGGGGDVGGGGAAPLLDCAIVPGSHVEVASLEGFPVDHQWVEGFALVASESDRLHFTVSRNGATGPLVEIFRHGEVGAVQVFDGSDVLGAAPRGGAEVAVLFRAANDVMLGRSDSATPEMVVSQTMFTAPVDHAALHEIPGGDLVFVLSTSAGGDSRAFFGRYSGDPVGPVRFTEANDDLTEEDVRVAAIVRQGTLNHVFLGDVGGPNGGRHYVFGDTPTEQAPTWTLGPSFHAIHATAAGPNLDLVVADTAVFGTYSLRVNTVPFAELSRADVSAWPVTAQILMSEVPDGAEAAFTGTHLALAGGVAGDPAEATVMVVSHAEGLVATGALAIGATLGELDAIDELRARPSDGFSATGRVDLIVRTVHAGGAHKKIHTLEVQCTAP